MLREPPPDRRIPRPHKRAFAAYAALLLLPPAWRSGARVAAFGPPVSSRPARSSLAPRRASPDGAPETKRRRKKNKYEKFSKVDPGGADPWEAAIRAAEDAQNAPATPAAPPPAPPSPRPRTEYPEAAAVDPYDPTTFGFVELGTIVGPHGVKGELRVRADTDFGDDRLCSPGARHLRPAGRRFPREVQMRGGRRVGDGTYLVRMEGVEDRDAARRHRGDVLYARTDDRPQLGEDEYRVDELVYMDVVEILDGETGETNVVGRVAGVVLAEDYSNSGVGDDLIDVLLPERTEEGLEQYVLIPFVPQLVPVVDQENRLIVVDPPPGLLDITYVREEKVTIRGLLAAAAEE